MDKRKINKKWNCLICNERTFNRAQSLSVHIVRNHKISIKEYYDTYLKQDPNDGICPVCNNPTKFLTITDGYRKNCSYSCSSSINSPSYKLREKTWKNNYGVDHPRKSKEIKEKFVETCLIKYGAGNPMQNKEIQDKVKNTNLEKYGYENTYQVPEFKDKIKKTCLEKYGVENALQSEEVKNKIQKTLKKKYNITTLDKINPGQIPEIQKKVKQTCLEKYGVEYAFQAEEVKEKIDETMLERYGVTRTLSSPEWREKCYDTMRKNNSFNISKTEEKTYKKLLEIYKEVDVIRQYKSKAYPFFCDFYIKSEDLYIECNYHWTHHDHFFDKTNQEDLEYLAFLENQANFSNYYTAAIHTWTVSDVKKKTTADKNKLNYLVFWSYKEFMEWYENEIQKN